MTGRLIFLAVCAVTLVVGQTETNQEEGEKHTGNNRTFICEKLNRTMRIEMENCFQMEAEEIRNATTECVDEVWPDVKGRMVDFVPIACNNYTLFEMYDACFAEYEKDEVFASKMEVTPETVACYQEVLEKYELTDYLSYVNVTTETTSADT